jgi:hypothetical protein
VYGTYHSVDWLSFASSFLFFSSGSLHWIAEITSQSIEEEGIATIRLDLERRLRIESKALFESTANYSSRWHAAELRTALEEGCAGDTSTARDRDLSSASNSSSVKNPQTHPEASFLPIGIGRGD